MGEKNCCYMINAIIILILFLSKPAPSAFFSRPDGSFNPLMLGLVSFPSFLLLSQLPLPQDFPSELLQQLPNWSRGSGLAPLNTKTDIKSNVYFEMHS